MSGDYTPANEPNEVIAEEQCRNHTDDQELAEFELRACRKNGNREGDQVDRRNGPNQGSRIEVQTEQRRCSKPEQTAAARAWCIARRPRRANRHLVTADRATCRLAVGCSR